MRKLIQGIVDFRENLQPSYIQTFERLALGQKPDALFVACSDSRVVPNLFASTEPGDLFVIRNVGNLIAPCDEHGETHEDYAEAAAIEYSMLQLGVSNIIICGHSECGATLAALDEDRKLSPNLATWLRNLKPSVARLRSGEVLDPNLSLHNQLSQINVLQQLEHLTSHPTVRAAIEAGKLKLHAWWFNIAKVEVEVFDPTIKRFRPIDREIAERMMQKTEMKHFHGNNCKNKHDSHTDFMSWKPNLESFSTRKTAHVFAPSQAVTETNLS